MDACVVVCVVVVGASLFLVAAVSLYRLWRRQVDTSENRTTNTTGFTKHFVVNEYTGEYLGESKFHYKNYPNDYYVLTTDWPTQNDYKHNKFKWVVLPGIGQMSDVQIMNLHTGRALKDSNKILNDKGDHCVTASEDKETDSSRWVISSLDKEDQGSFFIRNLFTGHFLGASKNSINDKYPNNDHHVLSSPDVEDERVWQQWRWKLALLNEDGTTAV